MSPFVWRVWIEISMLQEFPRQPPSPFVWRVWIEISQTPIQSFRHWSPFVWRVWIEILSILALYPAIWVTLRVEGVD